MWITDNFAEMGWFKLQSKVPIHVGGFSVDFGLSGIRTAFGQGI